MNKKVLCILIIILCGFASFAQQAAVVADIVSEEQASWQSVTYLVHAMSFSDEQNLTPEETFDFFKQKGLIPQNVSGQNPICYNEFSLFMLDAFDVPRTSMLFRAFGTKHYAFRQMVQYGLLSNSVFPTDTFSGSFLVTLIGNFMYMFPNASLKTM